MWSYTDTPRLRLNFVDRVNCTLIFPFFFFVAQNLVSNIHNPKHTLHIKSTLLCPRMQSVSSTKIRQLMLCREIIGVYFENLRKQKDTLCEQNKKKLNATECGKFRLRTDHEVEL